MEGMKDGGNEGWRDRDGGDEEWRDGGVRDGGVRDGGDEG